MDNLEKKIKRTETRIMLENAYIEHQADNLKKYITPQMIAVMTISGFALGYLISRKKTPPQVIKSLISSGHKLNKLYQTIKFILPII